MRDELVGVALLGTDFFFFRFIVDHDCVCCFLVGLAGIPHLLDFDEKVALKCGLPRRSVKRGL